MKSIRLLLTLSVLSFLSSSVISQGYHVRIGTIGNSITHGIALPNPLSQAFPVLLNDLLKEIYGDTCSVKNFGLTTTTMLKNGDVSYWDTQHLKDYLAFAPEICFIMLGTNDTKPYNWDVYGDEFIDDYLSMMDTIKKRNPSTRFILAYPPPAYEVVWDIRDSIILHGVIPAIDSIAKLEDVEIMDFYYPLLDSVHLFPDKIHPGIEGNILMAHMLLERIIETDIVHRADTGMTFITGFETDLNILPAGDEAELSWTTINADSVFINGALVGNEGNMIVTPAESTAYTMIAMGQQSNDTSSITLEVYVQELARLRLNPGQPIRKEGDTIFFLAYHYDQFNAPITRNYADVSWSIDGDGSLYEETDTSVFFICDKPGTSFLKVSYNDTIYYESKIVIRANATGISEKEMPEDVMIFPNPGNDIINIKLNIEDGPVQIHIFDNRGALQLLKEYTGVSGKQALKLDIGDLSPGSYIIKIRSGVVLYTRQFIID